MAERKRDASEICGERKPGGIDVARLKEPGHVKAGDTWHQGEVSTHEQTTITSDHLVRHTRTTHSIERVEWADPMANLRTILDRIKPDKEQTA